MVRARSGKTVLRKRARTRKLTKGFRLGRHNLYKQASITLIRARKFAFGFEICQNTCPATNAVAHLHSHLGMGTQKHICARAKFDQSHALAALQVVAYFGMEHNSPRQQSRDLLEYNHLTVAFHPNDILFVFLGGSWIHGVQKFSAPIPHFANDAGDRGTIYVNIKNT